MTWLKDGLPLPSRAVLSTEDGVTQLLLRAAEFSDSGTYTLELGDGQGKRETFSFQVQITGNSLSAVHTNPPATPSQSRLGQEGLRAALGGDWGVKSGHALGWSPMWAAREGRILPLCPPR